MDFIPVELKKTKFIAYFFDGTEKSAIQFCRKWGGNYEPDFLDKTKFCITLPSGNALYMNNYVVIDGQTFTTYREDEFLQTFDVIGEYRRQHYSFMDED